MFLDIKILIPIQLRQQSVMHILKQQLGMNAEAVRLGVVTNETAYALEHFGFEAPRFIEKAAPEVSTSYSCRS